jgi:lipopolysaccharide/colanic/teichoic acid biosynthesis glycosyltransferase
MRVPSPTSRSGQKIYLSLFDLSWAAITPILALYLRDSSLVLNPDWDVVGSYWLVSASCAAVAFLALRLQDGMTRHFSVHDALDVGEAVLFAELMTFLALFTLTRLDRVPRTMPLTHGLLLLGGLLIARIVIKLAFADNSSPQYHSRSERIIVIGANPLAASFIRLIEAFVPQRQTVIAVLDASADIIGKAISGVRVLGPPHELEAVIAEFAVHGVTVDRIVVASEADALGEAVQHEVERICKKRQIRLAFLPRMLGLTEIDEPAPIAAPVATTQFVAVPSYFRWKRLIDVTVSLSLIIALSPIFLLAGLLVLIDVGRPLLFWQQRLGWKGHSFLVYKLRTMRAPFGANGGCSQELRKPSAIGRFLRATRLDELPQLFNVVLGDMSLIGPRPLLPEDQPANLSVRLSVRPGISGWAQLNGGKLITPEEKEKLDEWYVRNASFGLDLKIALMTLLMVTRTRMSSQEAQADTHQAQTKFADELLQQPNANVPSVAAPELVSRAGTLLDARAARPRRTSVGA